MPYYQFHGKNCILYFRHYDMERVTMTAQGSKFLKLDVPGLAEGGGGHRHF